MERSNATRSAQQNLRARPSLQLGDLAPLAGISRTLKYSGIACFVQRGVVNLQIRAMVERLASDIAITI